MSGREALLIIFWKLNQNNIACHESYTERCPS
jgi:hypothetical protein